MRDSMMQKKNLSSSMLLCFYTELVLSTVTPRLRPEPNKKPRLR